MKFRSVSEIDHIEGKKILLRSDLNVPLENGVSQNGAKGHDTNSAIGATDATVRDEYRISRALPTIQFLTSRGAKVILMTHLGDDGSSDLAPIVQVLESHKVPLAYISSTDRPQIEKAVAAMENGNVLLLPNLRAFAGEKENDTDFAKWLAELGQAYVNDAFSVSHREHASVVAVPKYLPSYAGMQLLEEIEHLSSLSTSPEHPFAVIFGGAKLGTKLHLIEKLSIQADFVTVGGALLNQILFLRGLEVGRSYHDEEKIDLSIFENPKFYLPEDVVVRREGEAVNISVSQVGPEDVIVDIGHKSVAVIEAALVGARTVLWNGPMGKYEEGFGGATEAILKKLAALSQTTKATVGGGDTVALVSKLGLQDKLYFVSTGGGATLEYLEKGTLIGLEAISL